MSARAHTSTGRIAVAAQGPSLEARTDPRFGRCACFLIVDPDTLAFDLLENGSLDLASGAGIGAARLLIDAGVSTVIVRHVGPNPLGVLQAAGIQVFGAGDGTVRQALAGWRDGSLRVLRQARPAPWGGGARHRGPRSSSRACRTLDELRLEQRSLRRRLEDLERQIRSLERRGPGGAR